MILKILQKALSIAEKEGPARVLILNRSKSLLYIQIGLLSPAISLMRFQSPDQVSAY